MNRNIKFILLSSLLLACSSFANAQAKVVYCPPLIKCLAAGKIASCKVVGGSKENLSYWATDAVKEKGIVVAGVYTLDKVFSYHQNKDPVYTTCQYSNVNEGFQKHVILPSKREANLEAPFNKKVNWQIDGYQAECVIPPLGKTVSCPLVEKPEILILQDKNEVTESVIATCKGISTPIQVSTARGFNEYILTHDNVVLACGKKRQCTIKLEVNHSKDRMYDYSQTNNVVIDMVNNMKILKVDPVFDTTSWLVGKQYYGMRQVTPMNTLVTTFIEKK